MKVDLQKGEGLRNGERYVLVDGVRWGRTRVTHHGVRGTQHWFEQLPGRSPICDAEERRVVVRSESVRRYANRFRSDGTKPRPTEEIVLEKAKELVRLCLLRHPDNVAEERRRASEAFAAKQAKRAAKEQREFEAKAAEALGRLRGLNETTQVKIMVEAMRWAQER